MTDKIRVEVELPVDQIEQLVASARAEPQAVRELTDEELDKVMDQIRGAGALDEAETAIIGKLINKVVSKISSKQVQRVVADTVVTIVADTVSTAAVPAKGQPPGPKQ